MDPNELLRRIRQYVRAANENGLTLDEKFELIEYVEELDRWLMSGGFLPQAWAERVGSKVMPPSDDPWTDTATLAKGEPPF